MIALILAGHLLNGPVPPPEPRGTDLLWSQALPFDADGMPMIPLGVMEGREAIEVVLEAPGTVLLGQQQPRRMTLEAGSRLRIEGRASRAATIGHFVVVETHPLSERSEANRRVKYWRALGYKDARLLPLGVQMALSGVGFDNRALALAVAHSDTAAKAEVLRQDLAKRFKARSHIDARLLSLPTGPMRLSVGGAPHRADERIGLRFEGRPRGAHFALVNTNGGETRHYRGQLEVVFGADGKLTAVALIRAEELVAGTVPAESYASGPIEALKAQAVAARTELFSKLGQRHGAQPYLLCDEQDCQVYRGDSARHPRTDAACAATRGQLLFDSTRTMAGGQYRLAHAQYSAICGGHSEDNDAVWNQRPSALLRGHPDGNIERPGRGDEALRAWITDEKSSPWCRVSTMTKANKFQWQQSLDARAIAAISAQFGLGELRHVSVLRRGVSGRALSLELRGSRGRHVLEPELTIRRQLGNLPSSLFVISTQKKGRRIQGLTFTGRGWGHGVGMCQMGAIGMAEAGYKVDAILKHYYPAARVQAVY